MIMDRLYGGVCYAGIDTDPELKYPKGAGRVAFSNQQSYIAAISARFVQLQHGDIDKRVSCILENHFKSCNKLLIQSLLGFPGGLDGKETACNAGDLGSVPGSGSSPGKGNGNPLQYSCLENSMDIGAWWLQFIGSQRVGHN